MRIEGIIVACMFIRMRKYKSELNTPKAGGVRPKPLLPLPAAALSWSWWWWSWWSWWPAVEAAPVLNGKVFLRFFPSRKSSAEGEILGFGDAATVIGAAGWTILSFLVLLLSFLLSIRSGLGEKLGFGDAATDTGLTILSFLVLLLSFLPFILPGLLFLLSFLLFARFRTVFPSRPSTRAADGWGLLRAGTPTGRPLLSFARFLLLSLRPNLWKFFHGFWPNFCPSTELGRELTKIRKTVSKPNNRMTWNVQHIFMH